jgi:hypothetical protein
MSNPNREQQKWVKEQMHGIKVVKKENVKDLREEIVYKYSNKGKGQLKESVIIEGKSYFLKYSETKDCLMIEPYIDEETRRLRPPYEEEYPYEPYVFDDVRELDYYLQRAKKATIHSLYQTIKSTVKLFNDIDDKPLNLFSADILATYFQDRFSTVHYIVVVGDNGTGKSSIADTFDALGYRTVVMTNPTRAIWYRVLGAIEYGQVTIVADESEGIEESLEIMSILKDGYQTKHKIPRMDSDNKKPEWYYPFCIKVIICEKSPREDKAKGLLDRSFKIKTYKGYPQYDIKEVTNPQGNRIRQKLLDQINDLRKLLLVFKLYHRDPLPELEIGIDGRDKELCKPLIQLFYTTESQKEIEETLQYFIDTKNERKQQSLEAVMCPIIINEISQNGNEITSRKLFELVTENLDGYLDNQNLFYSTNYGKLYINKITKIACDKLGAEDRRGTKTHTMLIFNEKILSKTAKIYGIGNRINTKLVEIKDDAPDAPDAPWKDSKPFYTLKEDDHNKILGVLSVENDKENGDMALTEDSSTPRNASFASSASLDYPPNCYYCDRTFSGMGKPGYEKHVVNKHPGKPGYPGLADIGKYGLKSKGLWWER